MSYNSHEQAAREMITYLLDNLPTGINPKQVKLPNTPITERPNNAPWLRATVLPSVTVNHLATGKYQRTTGIFVIDVFYPINKGDSAAWSIAEHVQQRFTNRGTDHVSFFEAYIRPVGEDNDTYRIMVEVNYSHEGLTHGD